MPIYEYQCESCSHSFESFLSMSNMNEPLNEPCPECGKNEVNKRVSKTTMGVDMNLKTPGWFKDKMDNLKKKVPKRFHNNLDQAAHRTGGKLGPQ